jgi:formylglycine-generating enzyme required for sulfatase activity
MSMGLPSEPLPGTGKDELTVTRNVMTVVVLICGICPSVLGQQDAAMRLRGRHTEFSVSLPDGWSSSSVERAEDDPGWKLIFGPRPLALYARNTDNLTLWWYPGEIGTAKGLVSVHRFEGDTDCDVDALLGRVKQCDTWPTALAMEAKTLGRYKGILGGGLLKDDAYAAVALIPAGKACYLMTIVGPQAVVNSLWQTFVATVSSLDAPELASAVVPNAGATADGGGAIEGQKKETTGPDGGTYVWVPPGEFMMGSDDGPADERPKHSVRITKGFWLSKYEVTNAQYWRYCQKSGSRFPDTGGVDRDPAHPVAFVTAFDAVAYCRSFNLRLPTEAEWEYSARGPDSLLYPWGNTWDPRRCFDRTASRGSTCRVDSFPEGASWCGAFGMAGNVGEWCQDFYSSTYYARSPAQDPPGPGRDDPGVAGVESVVIRGCGVSSSNGFGGIDAKTARCSNRFQQPPVSGWAWLGFRVVMDE